jgi:hypothetical protein
MSESLAELTTRLRDYAEHGTRVTYSGSDVYAGPLTLSRDDARTLLDALDVVNNYREWLEAQNPDDAVKVRYVIAHFDKVVPQAARAGAGGAEAG